MTTFAIKTPKEIANSGIADYPFGAIKVGDVIKALDFKPMPNQPDCFLIGTVKNIVVDTSNFSTGYFFEVKVVGLDAEADQSRLGTIMYVPVATSQDFDERIEVLNK